MKKNMIVWMAAAAGLAAAIGARPASSASSVTPAAAPRGNAEHGRYLVMNVAMCVQCHSPRDEQGNLIESRLLEGAPMPVRSPWSSIEFAYNTPNIRGFNGYTDEQAIRLLTTGINRNGRAPKPPMPPFRMSVQDASDVLAFLKTLD